MLATEMRMSLMAFYHLCLAGSTAASQGRFSEAASGTLAVVWFSLMCNSYHWVVTYMSSVQRDYYSMRRVTVAVVRLLYTIVMNVSTINIVHLYTEPYILNSSIPKALM